jgi:hypothetical protein
VAAAAESILERGCQPGWTRAATERVSVSGRDRGAVRGFGANLPRPCFETPGSAPLALERASSSGSIVPPAMGTIRDLPWAWEARLGPSHR